MCKIHSRPKGKNCIVRIKRLWISVLRKVRKVIKIYKKCTGVARKPKLAMITTCLRINLKMEVFTEDELKTEGIFEK